MVTPPERNWTLDSYIAHNEGNRVNDQRFLEERDRRYVEIDHERQKAMNIKAIADQLALDLVRQAQDYKDEKANQLRDQIASERGLYATKADIKALSEKFDVMNKPVVEFMASQTGRTTGISGSWAMITGIVTLLVGLSMIGTFVFGSRNGTTPATPAQIIYVPAQQPLQISPPTR